MLLGNEAFADASDPKGIYDVNQTLVFHFNEGETLPRDATAYAVHATASKTTIDPAGWIGAAAKFDGQGGINIDAVPALAINPDNGWTFSTWAKIDQPQQNAVLVQSKDAAIQLELAVQDSAISARYHGADGFVAQTSPVTISLSQWQHIAVVAQKGQLILFLNGQLVADTAIQLAAMNPSLTIGGQGFVGLLDEVQVAKQARSADWIKLQFRSQSPDFTVVNFGQDESGGDAEGPNYFVIILQSLTVDGWVVIALCGVMFVISLLVMIGKGFK
jgi:biopolymer transport protein ExbB